MVMEWFMSFWDRNKTPEEKLVNKSKRLAKRLKSLEDELESCEKRKSELLAKRVKGKVPEYWARKLRPYVERIKSILDEKIIIESEMGSIDKQLKDLQKIK